MAQNELKTAFTLVSRLLEATTLHDLNLQLMLIINEFEGVEDASAYEILGRSSDTGSEAVVANCALIGRFIAPFDSRTRTIFWKSLQLPPV